eukprot:TRINITY_DN3112_c0_g2_i1.p1 TRINITY_DN3112_c0_g2~~TRINITY_DN3112_c0_g2_i1.p1  ORF type:complete len:434 (+),score=99.04 TRINITY_DN3112_c0_g2_i1:96-1397(+)
MGRSDAAPRDAEQASPPRPRGGSSSSDSQSWRRFLLPAILITLLADMWQRWQSSPKQQAPAPAAPRAPAPPPAGGGSAAGPPGTRERLIAELAEKRAALAAARRQLRKRDGRVAAPAGSRGNPEARMRLLDAALEASRIRDPHVPALGMIEFTVQRHVDYEVMFGPVSSQYAHQAGWFVEQLTRDIMERDIKPECGSSSLGPLFIEIGANEGSHGRLAARWGCRTIQVEPQPQCAADLSFAIALAGERHTGRVFNAFATDVAYSLKLPWRTCVGTSQMAEAGVKDKFNSAYSHKQFLFTIEPDPNLKPKEVRSLRIDDLAHEDVLALKIDCEGAEVRALKSAMGLVSNHYVKYLFIEFSPKYWRDFGVSREKDIADVTAFFKAAPYSCYNLGEIQLEKNMTGEIVRPDLPAYWEKMAWNPDYGWDIELWCTRT